ncbi:MAG: hypothetical protein V9E94_15880 [Microthrixaceae bacterium]
MEHDHRGGARALGEPLVQEVDRLLGLDARHLEVVHRATTGDPVRSHQTDHHGQPHQHHETPVFCHPASQTEEHVRHGRPPEKDSPYLQ